MRKQVLKDLALKRQLVSKKDIVKSQLNNKMCTLDIIPHCGLFIKSFVSI